MVARGPVKPQVAGSNPARGATSDFERIIASKSVYFRHFWRFEPLFLTDFVTFDNKI